MMHPECGALQTRAEHVLAGGPGTFSKHPSRYPEGFAPYAIVRSEGPYVVGSNEQTYLDTVAALGAVMIGHNDPEVNLAVMASMDSGVSHSLIHPLEIEVAEQLCGLIPSMDMVRFMRNGTDATHTAVRLARAITGKRHVLFVGYHGGAGDAYGSTTDKDAGILRDIKPYNHQRTWASWETVPDAVWEDLACLMTEVPALPWGSPPERYRCELQAMQMAAHENGALFVLDEIVTFPRASVHGAQEVYGVYPDLTCVSKGLANGWPLAALGGRREYMQRMGHGDIFASWTFAGETTALAAAQATLRIVEKPRVLPTMHTLGWTLGDTYGQMLRDYPVLPGAVYGHPWRLRMQWADVPQVATALELRTLWLQEHARRDVLMGMGVIFPMTSWTQQEVNALTQVGRQVCEVMSQALMQEKVQEMIECPIINDVLSVR